MRISTLALLALLVTASVASAQEAKHDPAFTLGMAAYTAGTIADVASTHAAIQSGYGKEGNPIMTGGAVRIAAGAGIGLLLVKAHRTHPKAATIASFALGSLWLMMAAHNAQIAGGR